jgi:hypothetical protein
MNSTTELFQSSKLIIHATHDVMKALPSDPLDDDVTVATLAQCSMNKRVEPPIRIMYNSVLDLCKFLIPALLLLSLVSLLLVDEK